MKTYVCDACHDVIDKPHNVGMKEFYIGASFDYDCVFPYNATRKTKVHLCDDCYHSLKYLADKQKGNKNE